MRSKTFETSEVHRRLLHYLAEKTFSGEADRLKEYVIGLEAFSKPSTYDPKRDSIVRLQVGSSAKSSRLTIRPKPPTTRYW